MFFKGYVLTKNKKCIEKFKGRTDFKSYEEVKNLPEFAGILGQDTVLVDIDDHNQSEILFQMVKDLGINCRVYQTTRGKHFLFHNPDMINSNKTHTTLACGLTADIKIGKRNSYEVLKFDGKERPILYDTTGSDEKAQDIPKWLVPVKTKTDFLELEAGDGRNQALFNYILTLQSNDFSVDEARETIKLLNNYVLKDPLEEHELETILRDEAFAKPVFFNGAKFLFDKFASFLKNNHHILRINNQLHIYKDGIYIPGYANIESAMIEHIPGLSAAKRTEVIKYLEIMPDLIENTPATDSAVIAFRNGLLNIKTDDFMPFSPDYIITNMIPWDYNPEAYSEAVDTIMDNISCGDSQIRAILEEMTGYCMFRRNELGKAFILTGEGSNGKSTFLNMLKNMLGRKNLSVLDIKKLDDRFSTIMMFGKLANIGDDISDEFLVDSSVFKKIVTGESIDAEQKGQPKFQFDPYVKLIFSANNIPRMGKGRDSAAIMRRLIIIPFNAKFGEGQAGYVPFIGDKLKDEESMEYLICLGIKGLKRVLENRAFTKSEKSQAELEEFEETNNPILGFFKEMDSDDNEHIENQPTATVYRRYQEYCIENNLTPMSAGEFSKQVKKHYNFSIVSRRIDKKVYRIFVKGE